MLKLKRNIIIPTDAEDAEITAAALSDPDAQPLTDEQLAKVRPYREVHGRGRPKAVVTKQSTTVRFDAEILEYFKSTGAGWQSRMNEVLRHWVNDHKV